MKTSKLITIDEVAKVAHEVNKAYCESMGDTTQPVWSKIHKWQKESLYDGIRYIVANPKITPEQAHENWMKHKVDNGWKYGKVKDPKKKEHPSIKPYNKLDDKEKAKDYIFQAIVKTMYGFNK